MPNARASRKPVPCALLTSQNQVDLSQHTAAVYCSGEYLFILGLKLLLGDLQLEIHLLIIVELAQYVRVIGLALTDGGVQGDDNQGLGHI